MDSYLRDDDGEALRAQRVAVALFIARRLGFPGTATEAEWRCVAEAARSPGCARPSAGTERSGVPTPMAVNSWGRRWRASWPDVSGPETRVWGIWPRWG